MPEQLPPRRCPNGLYERTPVQGPLEKITFAGITETQEIAVSCENHQAPIISTLEEVRVEMADMRADCRPIELVTNVGSCVAICIYDPTNKCGGLAHIMLPDSKIAPKECCQDSEKSN